jgi:hypothetical protein
METDRVKLALVVGSAACIWDDVRNAREMATFDAVCCIKRVGIEWPEPFQVWATLHPEFMEDYEAKRAAKGYPGGHEIVCPPQFELGKHFKGPEIPRRVPYNWKGMNASASSGIYGAKIMIDSGYRVVLAGVPMNNEKHFVFHEKWKDGPWAGLDGFTRGLELATPHLLGKCKSMSGKTKEILGAPTPEWLAGGTL